MTTPSFELLAALAFAILLAATALTYRRQWYWERRAHAWQDRLKAQLDVLRALVQDARDTQRRFRGMHDPTPLHAAFIAHYETALRQHFGAGYAARLSRTLSKDWLQPPNLASEQHIFAWYDTERRIAALEELITETADDLASINLGRPTRLR